MKAWYEELFKNFANNYEGQPFTHGTKGECDFIEREIDFCKEARIIDIGCGTGRHSLELAQRGYHNITGIDLSECMLSKARKKAKELNLQVSFLHGDARELQFNQEFDLAIMLCEGGFCLMESDEMNYAILGNAVKSLIPGGKFIFTCLNGLFPLYHSVKEFYDNAINSSKSKGVSAIYDDLSFDLMTLRETNNIKVTDDSGQEKVLNCNERYYVPSEITWQLKTLGINEIDIYGAKLGAFSRDNKLSIDDFEMLIIGRK